MSRLYTGQHGIFYVWVQDELFGNAEGIDVSRTEPTAGLQYIIRDGSDVRRTSGTATVDERRRIRRQGWEAVGWVRKHTDDYPGPGDKFEATGSKANLPAGWRWHGGPPKAGPDITGQYEKVATVRNWSFSQTAETIDATVLGSTYRDKLGGLKGITGQAQMMYYRDDNDAETVISNMMDAMYYQDSETEFGHIQPYFRLHHSGNTNRDFAFAAVLTNISMNCAVGEVVTVDVSFEAMGQPYRFQQSM